MPVVIDGYMGELAQAIQIAFYVAMPGAMFYVGGVLSKLAARLDFMSEELDKVAAKLDRHLDHHHSWGGSERRRGLERASGMGDT